MLRSLLSKSLMRGVSKFPKKNLSTVTSHSFQNLNVASQPFDFAKPNAAWSAKTVAAFNALEKEKSLTDPASKWNLIPAKSHWKPDEFRTLTRSAEQKQFMYSMFVNKEDKQLDCVLEFGPWAQGPAHHAHGGAISTMFDVVMGMLAHAIFDHAGVRRTANLTVNFKRGALIGETFLMQGRLKNIDGRKIFLEAEMVDFDNRDIYATATSLFIELKSKL